MGALSSPVESRIPVDASAPVRKLPGRVEYVGLLASLMALGALGIDMMLPAFELMRASLGLEPGSPAIAQTVTTYFLGMAGAQLFFGPLSDRYGRRPVVFAGIGIYVIGAVGSALAPSLGVLLFTRFVWGFGSAAGRVVVLAIVRDSFVGDDMARTMSTLMAVFLLVPILAPSLGSLVIDVAPWRTVFWISAVLGVGIAIWASFRLPETLAVADRQPIRVDVLRASAKRVLTEPSSLVPLLGVTVLTSVFTSYLASSEAIIGDVFGRGDQFALIFGATAGVFGLASLLNGRLVGRFGMRRLLAPVMLLYAIAAVALAVVSLTSDGRPEFWVFYPLLALAFASSMILNPNLNTMALVPLGDIAGTASSIIGAISLAAGSIVGALLDRRFDGSVTPLSLAVLTSATITSMLVARVLSNLREDDLR